MTEMKEKILQTWELQIEKLTRDIEAHRKILSLAQTVAATTESRSATNNLVTKIHESIKKMKKEKENLESKYKTNDVK